MFKLVVLCAFLAAVVAEPGLIAPLAYSSSYISPASTIITNQASSVLHPSPLVYSAPWIYNAPLTHFIKKRSPSLLKSYIAPSPYIAHTPFVTAYAPTPVATTYAAGPWATTYAAPIYSAAAHLIKKRSAPLILHSTYAAPSYVARAPLLTSIYSAAAPILSSPIVSTAPVTYTHFIKKRSAPLALTYAAPASFSHQSRVDIRSSPAVTSYAYSAPLGYSAPLAYSAPLGYSATLGYSRPLVL